jgi:Asp-tRNA(Asn)/Glu-tRNA(Gln) amidotransferase C subunit
MPKETRSKIMTLEVLSSIKGAKASDVVDKLFSIVKNALSDNDIVNTTIVFSDNEIALDKLRDDVIIESSELERKLIIENFPVEKNDYLVVNKVIED